MSQSHLVETRVQGFMLKLLGPALIGEKGHNALSAVGTVHVSHFVPFENNQLGFFTVFDGSFEKYIQDFADKTSFTFDTLFPNIVGGSPTPVEKNAQAFYQWALDNNYPPIGFYSAYPGISVQDIRRCWLIASPNRPPLDMAEVSRPRASRHVFRVRGRVGSGHQGVRACGGLYRQDLASPLADIHGHSSHVCKPLP